MFSVSFPPVGENYVRCHFCVKDNGIGMTKEFQEKIFDTFTREEKAQINKIEGTGLGMAITKAIVQAMNGTIDLKSAPFDDSAFGCELQRVGQQIDQHLVQTHAVTVHLLSDNVLYEDINISV